MLYFNICYISFVFLFVMSLLMIFLGVNFMLSDYVVFVEWELFTINSSTIVMTLLFDWMSLIFLGFVMFISSMVIFYSSSYMSGDYNINRFILLVLMFVFSMGVLIVSPNLVSLLLGWDGLGLVSYCLVIYYQNVKSYNAGMLTALSNRVGDVAILLSIAWLLNFGSWNYIYYTNYFSNHPDMMFISFLIVLAGMTKSAQIPFSAWLPAAMAAPTPVSSLVHSSTLVTAGVYLLIRFSPVVSGSFIWYILLLLSVMTMFMAGLGANFEFDLKKIIALSTLSQLGVMMSILSLGYPILAYFHLLTHAMFKALLFLCAGAMIHSIKDWQDIRSLGLMSKFMPTTSMCLNIANLALCGMPFLAGFYSKDLILEVLEMKTSNIFIFIVYFISTGLTAVYSFRLIFYSMMGDNNMFTNSALDDSEFRLTSPMIALTSMAITVGSMLCWVMFTRFEMICLPNHLKMLTLSVCLFGAWMGLEINQMKIMFTTLSSKLLDFCSFLGSMWFLPTLSTVMLSSLFMNSGLSYMTVDQRWGEYFGAQGLYKNFMLTSSNLQLMQASNIKIYLMTFFFWVLFILMVLFVL
uniref:NADH-ubiquinone oxidoreductase chain 5 n=1 Tax=Songmachilis xinxiangensis TaxID=1224734 RepID=R4IK09_9INSE|nr:NADH dehydrogenase subunit 5 [Songmachilis xinxiangensis]AFQ07908.1 NADH dehydrogenase subunit 5 [Songmachilis xinxiangensis]